MAQMARDVAAGSAPRALSRAYLRDDLQSLADSTRGVATGDRAHAGGVPGPALALGGVAGLVSELNGVLAYSATLGESLAEAQREMLHRRVSAIVGALDRLSGGGAPTSIESARALALGIRADLLEGRAPIAGEEAPGAAFDISA